MISPALINAAAPLLHDDGPLGKAHDFYRGDSPGHTIPLFRKGPGTHSEPMSEADMHAYVKAEVDRITHKYSAMGFKDDVDTRSGQGLLQERTNGRMRLTPINGGMAWTGTISVGTGAGRVLLAANFDSGFRDLIVLPCQYDPARSTSAQQTGQTFEMTFMDGNNAQGSVILETVRIAGLESSNFPIRHATTSTLNSDEFQAIVGMALVVTQGQRGLIPTLTGQGRLQRNLFGFGLWRDAGARLDLGAVPRQYQGQISWTDAVIPERDFWRCEFGISGVEETQLALLDTGESMIVGPMELVRTVFVQAGIQTLERDGVLYGFYRSDGPTPYVAINIAGVNIVLSAQSLAYNSRRGITYAGIVGKRGTQGWWVLGGTFFQNVYAIFDGERQRIGFAPH
ncbi:hypothetical protein V8E36_002938 [Tilletia maclaganii]